MTAYSGEPVVGAGNLPSDVLLRALGVHVDDFPFAVGEHYDCEVDYGKESGLRVYEREIRGLGWRLKLRLRHGDGDVGVWC